MDIMKTCFSYLGAMSVALFMCACSTQPLTWQQRRLEQPTEAELQWEREGHVMIYEGMKDREVDHVMDSHFNRIQGMMFINTVVTDDDGLPLKDPKTGIVVTEHDGCD
jgi:hypothetical protein